MARPARGVGGPAVVVPIVVLCAVQPWRTASLAGVAVPTFYAAGLGLIGLKYLGDLILRRSIQELRDYLPYRLLAPLVLWIAASLAWSSSPGATMFRLAVLVIAIAVAARWSRTFPIIEVITQARRTMAVLVGLSWVAVLGGASGSRFVDGTSWQGIFAHKNELGEAAGVLMLFTVAEMQVRRRSSLLWATLGLATATPLLSNAATALVAGVLTIVALGTLKSIRLSARRRSANERLRRRFLSVVSGLGVSAFMLVALYLPSDSAALSFLGRSESQDTLFIRRSLWEQLVEFGREQWLTGLGFGVSALDQLGGEIEVATVDFETNVAWQQSHNGYLEMFLQIGVIGLALVMALYLALLGRSASRILDQAPPNPGAVLVFSIATYQLILAMTSAVLLTRGTLLLLVLLVGYGGMIRFDADAGADASRRTGDRLPGSPRPPTLGRRPKAQPAES